MNRKNKNKQRLHTWFWIAGVLFIMGACNPDRSKQPATNDADRDEVSSAEVREEVGEAAESIRVKFEQERTEVAADLRKLQQEIDARVARLRDRMEEEGKENLPKIQKEIGELEIHREQIDVKLQELEKASQTTWQHVKKGVRNFAADVRQLFNRAEERVEEMEEQRSASQ